MSHLLDKNSALPLPCVGCGDTTVRTIAQIQQQTTVACPSCGSRFEIDTEVIHAAVERMEFMLHDLGRGLARRARLHHGVSPADAVGHA